MALLPMEPARAAPILGETRTDSTIIDCNISEDGTTTCSIVKGLASICARRTGGVIRRSFQPYDYLPQPRGCTLDQAYWLDHGQGGASSFDDIWERLGAKGPDAAFFNSGLSYGEIFGEPESQDAYGRLAKAYIATELNRLNGATLPTEVADGVDKAVALLVSQSRDSAAGLVADFAATVALLERFNTGAIGAGICTTNFQPLDASDVGKRISGLVSGNEGRIKSVEVGRGSGDGVVEIVPDDIDDLFIVGTEPFAVEEDRKAKFTQTVSDCVDVETGEQTTAEVGKNPEPPTLTTASFQEQARNMLVMVALNENATDLTEVAPAAGPGTTAPVTTTPTTTPTANSEVPSDTNNAIQAFPSETLPATQEASGGVTGTVAVPNVVGDMLSVAENKITSVGLRVGGVTVISSLEMERMFALIATAHAQSDDCTVESSDPAAGTEVALGSNVDLDVSCPAADMPEPSTMPLFAVALLMLIALLWWRSRRVSRVDAR